MLPNPLKLQESFDGMENTLCGQKKDQMYVTVLVPCHCVKFYLILISKLWYDEICTDIHNFLCIASGVSQHEGNLWLAVPQKVTGHSSSSHSHPQPLLAPAHPPTLALGSRSSDKLTPGPVTQRTNIRPVLPISQSQPSCNVHHLPGVLTVLVLSISLWLSPPI